VEKESVWDYPRPPKVEPFCKQIQIDLAGVTIVETEHAVRVCETSHPPVFYIPQEHIAMQYLSVITGASSFCEWKGKASYWNVKVADVFIERAAWSYADPTPPFISIKNYLAFYPNNMDLCTVDGERVTPQPGKFYGGWITKNLIGPFKGEPGTGNW
jgi:uncharacterized protein (DUF427 family)